LSWACTGRSAQDDAASSNIVLSSAATSTFSASYFPHLRCRTPAVSRTLASIPLGVRA
jgi:hypothetical protein